ncbi:hypothetical protein LY76DRAFT_253769 [Colletotrichum caudatum]|nr:hypothetical protein LY76DRAFT_253769 [Colletotrichum caudatum]
MKFPPNFAPLIRAPSPQNTAHFFPSPPHPSLPSPSTGLSSLELKGRHQLASTFNKSKQGSPRPTPQESTVPPRTTCQAFSCPFQFFSSLRCSSPHVHRACLLIAHDLLRLQESWTSQLGV